MKKTILLTGVLLVLTATVALAGGVNLNWGTVCYTEAPVSVVTFACNVNTGSWHMVSSFVIDAEMTDMVGFEIEMDGQSDQASFPDWWQIGSAPDCRAGKGQFASNFSTAPQVSCFDWTGGQSYNAYGYAWGPPLAANHAHITGGAAIDLASPFDMQPGVEYYAADMLVLNSKAVGTGACAGCSDAFTWGVSSITAAGLGGRRDQLLTPVSGGIQCLSWNNSGLACSAVPNRNRTWGQVKSLYR